MGGGVNTTALFLAISNGKRTTLYKLLPIDPHQDVATKAWRIWKTKKVFYDVAINAEGLVTCSCGDAVFRHRPCKHLGALRALGLLPRGQ